MSRSRPQSDISVLPQLDAADRAILQIISFDPMATNADIGERLGLSPSSALRRRQRLDEAGIITGYRAIIDHRALGHSDRLLIEMTITSSDGSAVEAIAKVLRSP
jgi:Lrp/AsnC family transcriptional regulator, leucine-responsive regulatory protein